jgi:MarR family transcriptional regulator, temperature-dependent positive regulator of motility
VKESAPTRDEPARLPVTGDDGAVFHLMRRVLQRHGARWSAALPEMTKAQWAVLRAVADNSRSDQNTIGEQTAIDKATLVPLIARLVDRGWMMREIDPDDRRRRLLRLTDAGRTALAHATPIVAAIDAAALDDLRTVDRARLRALLNRLV